MDKDIKQMMESLRKYDMLKESVAPVLGGLRNISEGDQPPWLKDDADKEEDDKEEVDETVDEDEDKEELDEDGDQLPPPPDEIEVDLGENDEATLFAGYQEGKLTIDELISALQDIAYTGHSQRQGEMGLQGDDTPQGNRNWDRDRQEYDDYDRMDYEDPPEYEDDLTEGIDKDVAEWMKRFANLGDLKGYGQ